MHTDRIDSISSYCDRWCERCAFTVSDLAHQFTLGNQQPAIAYLGRSWMMTQLMPRNTSTGTASQRLCTCDKTISPAA